MNSPALGLRVSSVIFGLAGLAHLIRIILSLGVQVGGYIIGRRWSVVAVIVCAALCVWLWMLASKAAKSKAETPPAKPAA
jgi:type VI protein secretion system component VasK